jgi:glycosyltransferase involved in cell wall biosynthesis
MFVITSMPVGGAETLLVNLLRSIDRRVLLPEVACLKEPGPLGEQIQSEIPVHTGLLHGKWDLLVLPRLIRLLNQRKIDAVITVGAGDKMFWGRIAARLAGVPVVASALHSTGWPDGVGRLNRYLTGITDAFIAVADSHGQFLREFEQFPADKVCVIRNGVDCQRFAPNQECRNQVRQQLGLGIDTLVAGIVAALRPEKNHAMLLQVAVKLRDVHPELRWLIVGDGPERDGLQSMAATLGVADRVHFMGTRSDTERILAALDLFALCSLNEASPVSILEALACGVPVVSTDVGSVKESILEGRTGRLVPSGDVEAFSAAVHAVLADPQVGRQMGSAGREHVCRTGSLESMVEGYQELITGLYDAKAVRKIANLSGRQERLKTACMARTSGSR